MTSYSWTATAGGDWNTTADWLPNGTPGAADTALFATGGNSYTVTAAGVASASQIVVQGDAVTFDNGTFITGTATTLGYTVANSGFVGVSAQNVGALVTVGTGALVDDSGYVYFDSNSFLGVDGSLATQGGFVGAALVNGGNWADGGMVTFNQLSVFTGGSYTGTIGLSNVGAISLATLSLDTSATFSGDIQVFDAGQIYVAASPGDTVGSYTLSSNINIVPTQPTVLGSAADTPPALLTLATDLTVTLTEAGSISGTGAVDVNGGNVILTGANTYSQGTLVDGASLTLVGGTAAGTGAVFLQDALLTTQAASGISGAETVVGSSGADTVNAIDGALQVFASNAAAFNFQGGTGASTVIGGIGAETVTAAAGGLLAFGAGATTLNFQGGAGASTVIGGSGVLVATGGLGNDIIYGGTSGQDALTTGAGPTTLVGGSGGVLISTAAGNDVLVASAGNTTLNGAHSTGANLYVTQGSGVTTIEAGAGQSTIVANGAANAIYGATGTQDVFLGTGVNHFFFTNGFDGGTNNIIGFGTADIITLTGYGADGVQNALISAVVTSGNTVLTLSDNTQIVLFGYTGLTSSSFT